MTTLNLHTIDNYPTLTTHTFREEYYTKNKPVIFSSFSKDWPAQKKWSLDYFKNAYGNLQVPLYSEAFANSGKSYLNAQTHMRFADYLDLIAHEPTQLRMFLFNIFRHVPTLCDDFDYPDFAPHFLKKFPFMFFGGANSWVDAHYDADLSHVFLTQFEGRKRVVLYAPDYTPYLYRHPLTVSANIDIGAPDFTTYPWLATIPGLEAILQPGETLFIPSGYWHYIYYIDGGFSLSLRAFPQALSRRLRGIGNLLSLNVLDRNLNKIIGTQQWYAMKEKIAQKKAQHLPPPTLNRL